MSPLKYLLLLTASSLCLNVAQAQLPQAASLPSLPPMPAVPAPQSPGSVTMGSADSFPEMRLDFPIASGPFEPNWESIAREYPGPPDWLREAKFGIWVHFGAQSAGQSGDWYAKRLYLQQGKYREYYLNHLRNFGHPADVGYKDVLRSWNPAKLDPRALVKIYQAAGARFLFLLGVHHDNFDNWDSKYQKWNSVNLGPRRDLLREWTDAARQAGMRYGVTFHHEYTWWWYQTAFGSDVEGPRAGEPYDGRLSLADGDGKWWEGYDPRMLYTIDLRDYDGLDVEFAPAGGIFSNHLEYGRWYATWWALRMLDVIEHYDPDFIYTDGNSRQTFSGHKSGTGLKADALQRVIAHYYNRTLQRRGKVDVFSIVKFIPPANGVVNTQEGSIPRDVKTDQAWIGETAVGDWFYRPGFVYDAGAVIRYLLENASRDGATAICVSLLPDGSLDEGSRRMLEQVGDWLRVNGDGIYGSSAWVRLGEGDDHEGRLKVVPRGKLGRRQAEASFSTRDFRFTRGKDGSLYAFCFAVPRSDEQLLIRSLGRDARLLEQDVASVSLLGYDKPLNWEVRPEGLAIRYPAGATTKIAAGFRIDFAGAQ
ncbi:MAG: alpha-L-fucosidase [Planctomycetales bacterium]|nr:alpha-L-fucosidase [Planctomycetales bacterium]